MVEFGIVDWTLEKKWLELKRHQAIYSIISTYIYYIYIMCVCECGRDFFFVKIPLLYYEILIARAPV